MADESNEQEPGQGGGETPAPTWDGWLESQDEATRSLIETHTSGLKSALQSERDARGKAEKALREAAGKAEAGSTAQQALTETADQLAAESQRADGYEALHAAGATNLKLAWLAAQSGDYVDRKGQLDVASLKRDFPELFTKSAAPRANAGSGTGDPAPKGGSMNDWIRGAAGRQ